MSVNSQTGRYDEYVYTMFPAEVDAWHDKMDMTAELASAAAQYKTYCAEGNYTAAKNLLNANPNLKSMIIDANTINEMRHAIMAIERMWRDDIESYITDHTFEEDKAIYTYTHTYDSNTKTHNFAGRGLNAKVAITAPYTPGDKFTLNGSPVSAFMGGTNLSVLFNGQYMYFFVVGSNLYFIGGNDTSGLMARSGGTFTGTVNFANGSTYYVDANGNCKFMTGKFIGTVYFANGTTYYINSSGDSKLKSLAVDNNIAVGGTASVTGAASVGGKLTANNGIEAKTIVGKNGSSADTLSVTGHLGVSSNITASGTITGSKVYNAVYNDYAEYFPRGGVTEAGDIIALNPDGDDETYVKAVHGMRIVGVHSDEYAHIIGGDIPDDDTDFETFNEKKYIPVGMMGRVHCKVFGSVSKGDYIVASDTAGVGKAVKTVKPEDCVVGFAVENSFESGLHKVKIKIGKC